MNSSSMRVIAAALGLAGSAAVAVADTNANCHSYINLLTNDPSIIQFGPLAVAEQQASVPGGFAYAYSSAVGRLRTNTGSESLGGTFPSNASAGLSYRFRLSQDVGMPIPIQANFAVSSSMHIQTSPGGSASIGDASINYSVTGPTGTQSALLQEQWQTGFRSYHFASGQWASQASWSATPVISLDHQLHSLNSAELSELGLSLNLASLSEDGFSVLDLHAIGQSITANLYSLGLPSLGIAPRTTFNVGFSVLSQLQSTAGGSVALRRSVFQTVSVTAHSLSTTSGDAAVDSSLDLTIDRLSLDPQSATAILANPNFMTGGDGSLLFHGTTGWQPLYVETDDASPRRYVIAVPAPAGSAVLVLALVTQAGRRIRR